MRPGAPALVAAAMLVSAAPVGALDDNQQFRTLGLGATSCSRFAELRASGDPDAWALFGVWAAGFLTSHNLLKPNTYDHVGTTTPEEMMGALDHYCDQMPNDPFVFALIRYIGEELEAKRLRRRSQAERP